MSEIKKLTEVEEAVVGEIYEDSHGRSVKCSESSFAIPCLTCAINVENMPENDSCAIEYKGLCSGMLRADNIEINFKLAQD
jgi:hypothetical protein